MKLNTILMDLAYALVMVLGLFGIHLVPSVAIPYLLLPAYMSLFWIYRQTREYGFGARGAPLMEQLGWKIPNAVHYPFMWLGFFVFFLFPFYISVLIAMAFDPSFDDPAHWQAWLKLTSGILMLVFVGFTWFCLGSDRDEKKVMPEKKQRLYMKTILPVTALLLGESAASLSTLIHNAWSDTGAEVLLALTVFIPLRFILIRTVGASPAGIYSFIAASVVGVLVMIYR